MTRVTVVIPAFNAAATLGATLESVAAQTFRDLDVVVVDDGSSDGTHRVAEQAGAACIRQENAGVSAARNAGVAVADSEFVAFLDADDVWVSEKLQRQVELLDARPELGACFTSALRVNADLEPIELLAARDHDDYTADLLLHSNVVQNSSSSLLLRAELARAVPHDSAFSQCADWDLVLRLSLVTRFAPVVEPLVLYRSAPGNMSSSISLLESDTFAVMAAFFTRPETRPWLPLRRRAESNQWMIISGSYFAAGARGQAIRCALNSIRPHPPNASRVLAFPARRVRRHSRG